MLNDFDYRTILHRQMSRCNAIVNMAEYYSTVIIDNSNDPKNQKLWQMFRQVVDKGHKIVLKRGSDPDFSNTVYKIKYIKDRGN